MILFRVALSREVSDCLEAFFCECLQERWILFEDADAGEYELRGYFDSKDEALEKFAVLGGKVQGMPAEGRVEFLKERDWRESYKTHFSPWSERGLHWVPEWDKQCYSVPKGETVLYLDPGMAFGTGSHETTRLCAMRLLDARDEWKRECSGRSVVDAGFGSGILALSAWRLGFRDIVGFDVDPDAVLNARENARRNAIDDVCFIAADLSAGLAGRKVDLVLANILADVLCERAAVLLGSIRAGGRLVMSGILTDELSEVEACFQKAAQRSGGKSFSWDSRSLGEWSDLIAIRAKGGA